MGAEIPDIRPSPQVPKTGSGIPLLIAGTFFLIVCALKWGDVVKYVNGEAQLTEKHQQQLKKKLDELEDAEQYALVAIADGMYPCLHSGRSLIYLRVGEVWKYGVTSKGEIGRYTTSFLLRNNVSYLLQFRGNFAECLKQEQIKLYNYPYLPENLARPPSVRLPRPPYNPVMR